jgi:hypothetical protein
MLAIVGVGFHHPPAPSSEEEGEPVAQKTPLLFRGRGWGWWPPCANLLQANP